jgi:hypothetical protein
MRHLLAAALVVLASACTGSTSDPAPAGAVTRIDTGPGLSGGPITETGTVRIAPGGVDGSLLASGVVTPAHLSYDPATQLELDAHGHDASYAALTHSHDGSYAGLSHAHDASYAALAHQHLASAVSDFTAAAETAMGAKADSNPLHHDRYTDAEAVSAVAGTYLTVAAAASTYLPVAGGTLTGPVDLGLHPPRNLRIEPAPSAPFGCGAAEAGAVYFDAALRALRVCDGSAWVSFASPPAAGSSPQSAATTCAALRSSDPSLPSGAYWLDPDGAGGAAPLQGWCEMVLAGGGWRMLLNSTLGTDTLSFWRIPYADRLGRKGVASPATNFYDGSLYSEGTAVLDVVEDLAGKQVILLEATYAGFVTSSMTFTSPVRVSGSPMVFDQHVAGGWSSVDYDGDAAAGSNCATSFAGVTQHYRDCFVYQLGADGEVPYEDGGVGPHLQSAFAITAGLVSDGSGYTRVRRITRFVR